MAIINKLPGHQAVSVCAPGGARFVGIGMPDAAVARVVTLASREVASERPSQAPAVAAAARRDAYTAAAAFVAHGAGTRNQLFGQQKTQLHTMWALRGLNPWSDPA